ncbi:hypothetical protein IX329_002199 [Fusobacterium necrophorum]|nr:hypothetical protein [Fusobacterium necrophorum]MBR8790760.1 hypothetical protein [Fusobacterium necrophorum]MBR8823664.1 hypothetical protein [Fusobacterium necrophorum]SDB42084.1 Adhesion protein FadA [Fusobacterium necrophorum]SQD10249.1 Adhesion protein FadA [Fusobacterium necrophorum subsp. necrophorum]
MKNNKKYGINVENKINLYNLRGDSMKKVILFCLLLSIAAYGLDSQELNFLNKMDAEYQELLQKEAEKLEEFKVEKSSLEEELVKLKEREVAKEEIFAKLGKDSEIRWHRDEYKKLAKRYEEYYKKLEAAIAEREGKITELEKLINIMSE